MAAVLLYLCFAFVVWGCTILPPVTAGRCPSSCECLGNNVDCSRRGLINVPTDIEPWVTRLELQSNGISEIRPDDFKGLSNLTYLDLSNNAVSVTHGAVFGDLINLRTLILDSNEMTEIPAFPVKMNITHLSMRDNHVVTIPLAVLQAMPKIENMDLTHNFILSLSNGSFPRGCPLKVMILNNNQIAAIERGSLNNLTSLEVLKLNGNKLTELPVGVFNGLVKLKILEMMRNKLVLILSLTFQGLKELQVLKLKRNHIGALGDGAFYGLKITNLQMDRNRISNITKGWLYGLDTLKQLSLPYNHIKSIETDAWKSCRLLERLNLTHNRLTTISETSLADLVSLRTLYLDDNKISRIDTGAFRDLAKLNVLQLNHNEISWAMEDFPGVFRGLSGLTKLGLKANKIRSLAIHTFSGLPRLRQLILEENDITSMKENVFETLRNLRDLHFNTSELLCDCHLAWLPVWLQHNGFQSTTQGTCHHPAVLRGLDMYKVDPSQLTCTKLPKPVILDSPKSANGFKGENLTLSCIIGLSGNSQPVIHWKKDNMPLGDENTEMVATSDGEVRRFTTLLHLVDIQDSMAGRYQCMVSNDFGSAFSQRAYVNVYVYPSFSKKPKDVIVKAGKPAELKCAATGRPQPVISWQKDGGVSFPAARERRMQVYPDDDRFYIMNTRPADEGVYSCMAKSEAGMIVYNATVTVLETPDFVQPMQRKMSSREGETSVLQCRASGSPQPKLTWMKDDKELVVTPRHFFTVGNQILVIVDTTATDAGVYSCRMSNSLGTTKGTTKLQVLSAGDSSDDSGDSSFGLDDESTTTGIIIIAVVCCVVGTSLVWVIIIYQTRKRHEVYSTTPTDETTLPVEVPSSGYMSSDKEGSYTQGGAPPSYYHYQEYQMKESGYESSSGQYRVNGHARPVAMFAYDDDDDDDRNPPVVTAGDRLLQQIRNGQSKSSLHYPCSDGDDTIGSRHSTSSGQHSGASTSDPPSSHNSGHSAAGQHALQQHPSQQLRIITNPLSLSETISHVHPHPAPSCPHEEDHTSELYSPGKQPGLIHLQTFHPTKPTNHDRLNRSISGISTSSMGRRDDGRCQDPSGCDCGDNFNSVLGKGGLGRERHHSDSCGHRDLQHPPSSSSSTLVNSSGPCPACHASRLAEARTENGCGSKYGANNSSSGANNSSSLRQVRSSSRSDNNVQNVPPVSSSSSFTSLSPVSQASTSNQKYSRQGQAMPHSCNNIHNHGPSLKGSTMPSAPSKHPNPHCTDCKCSSSYNRPHHHPVTSPTPIRCSPLPSSCSCCDTGLKGKDSVHHPSQPPHQSPTPSPTNEHHRPKCMCGHRSCRTSSPSKAMGVRSRSSSSVGRGDPMYYAYSDQCPPSHRHNDGKQHNCDETQTPSTHQDAQATFSHCSCPDCGRAKEEMFLSQTPSSSSSSSPSPS